MPAVSDNESDSSSDSDSEEEEEDEGEKPIVEFTSKMTKAQQRQAQELSKEEMEKKWEDDVSQLIDEEED